VAKEDAMEAKEKREQGVSEAIEAYVPNPLTRGGISGEAAFKVRRDELAIAAKGSVRLVSKQAREDRR
jgi:hypothetical protein